MQRHKAASKPEQLELEPQQELLVKLDMTTCAPLLVSSLTLLQHDRVQSSVHATAKSSNPNSSLLCSNRVKPRS